MWWNRREESSSNGYSSTEDRSEDESSHSNHRSTSFSKHSNHSQSNNNHNNNNNTYSFRSTTSSTSKKTKSAGASSRQSFLGGSKSLVPQRRSRRNNPNNLKKQRSKSTKETTSGIFSKLGITGNSSSTDDALHDLENTVAETHMGFEVSLASLNDNDKSNNATTSPRITAPSNNSSGQYRSPAAMKHHSSFSGAAAASPSSYSSPSQSSPSRYHATNTKVGGSKHTTHRGVQMKPVLSFQEELLARQKIHRTQYTVTQWPALGPKPKGQASSPSHLSSRLWSSSNTNNSKPPANALMSLSRHHRVQYPAAGMDSSSKPAFSFDDCLFLLRSHEVVDEMTSLREELAHMDAEVDALQKDKKQLEDLVSGSQPQQAPSSPSGALSPPEFPSPGGTTSGNNIPTAWDVNELLGSRSITVAQRSQLQTQRGIHLTVHFHDRSATEALASRCGIKNHVLAKFKESHKQQFVRNSSTASSSTPIHQHKYENNGPLSVVNNQLLLELTPDTCREGGAATHIQQIALLCKDGGRELSFFLGKDQGKSVYWGHLPDRLYRRMQDQGMNPKQSASELTYLATGPMDYYYAEFRSGEAWWGSSVDDRAFHSICTEWDVYRVAFGPCVVVEEEPETMGDAATSPPMSPQQQQPQSPTPAQQSRTPTTTSSWVVLSRDGRAAWKNIPSRLDRLLSSRMANQAGVAEVSLGCGDSYFCRFLDGTVDYCLPSTVAAVCQQLEAKGSTTITSIALHPELSQDFVIRSATFY